MLVQLHSFPIVLHFYEERSILQQQLNLQPTQYSYLSHKYTHLNTSSFYPKICLKITFAHNTNSHQNRFQYNHINYYYQFLFYCPTFPKPLQIRPGL